MMNKFECQICGAVACDHTAELIDTMVHDYDVQCDAVEDLKQDIQKMMEGLRQAVPMYMATMYGKTEWQHMPEWYKAFCEKYPDTRYAEEKE